MDEKVRVGFIGCGGRAHSHMRAIAAREDAVIVGVADVLPDAAQQAGGRWGVPSYTDHRRLLERQDLDAVILSLPVFAHGKVEFDVIARGIPFFVEKPVGRTLDTARRIAQALQAAKLWAAVGYQLRYEPAVRQAKAYLSDKTISVVEGHYWCGTARDGAWHNDWERSGGQLVEQATHTVDMMRFIVGEIEEVCSYQANRILQRITSPDSYVVGLRFAGGAIGALTTSWTYEPGDWSQANVLHLLIDGGLVRIQGGRAELLPAGRGALPEVQQQPGMYDAFVASVRGGRPEGVLSLYDDAVATLAVSLAANQSAREGRPVRVAEAVGA